MAGGFGTTQWSLILAAQGEDPERAREALAEICRTYWYPLYCLIRRRGHGADEAADLTQDFFVHLIEKGALRVVDPALGRFRSFLLASVKNFLTNDHDRLAAGKRGGGLKPVTFDGDEADRRQWSDGHADWDPERYFDRQWALTVLQRALDRLRWEYAQAGRPGEFEHLSAFLTGEGREQPYRQVAASLEMTEAAVKTAVHRMRRRYGKALREQIAATVGDPEKVDAELRYLLEALEG
jgi:RNA polymerase sigma-70 factor (ECF subfamily)